jgi:hypothetical protein
VPNLRATHESFLSFIRNNLPFWIGFSCNDQGALNYYYRGVWDQLDPKLNWKPYWGDNEEAFLIHFHGARALEIVDHVTGGRSFANKTELLRNNGLDGLKSYVTKYFQCLDQLHGSLSRVERVATDKRGVYCTVSVGPEAAAHKVFGVEIKVGEDPVATFPVPIPPSLPQRFVVSLPGPECMLHGEPQVHARLSFLQSQWVAATSLDPSREHTSYIVVDTRGVRPSRIDSQRERVYRLEQEGFKPYYANVHASFRVPPTVSTNLGDSVQEAEFPGVVIGGKSLDVSEGARVLMPEGLPLLADLSVEHSWAAPLLRSPEDRKALAGRLWLNGRVLSVSNAVCHSDSIDSANLLIVRGAATFVDWLQSIVSKLDVFTRAEASRNAPFLVGSPNDRQQAVLRLLGLQDRLLPGPGEGLLAVKQLFTVIEDGPDPISRLSRHTWIESQLASSLGSGSDGGFIALVSAAVLCIPEMQQICRELEAKGWHLVDADSEDTAGIARQIRSARVITMVDSKLGPLLIFAAPTASVQEIQRSHKVESTITYRVAIAKSLGYAVIIVTPDVFTADGLQGIVERISRSADRLRTANVVTSRLQDQFDHE